MNNPKDYIDDMMARGRAARLAMYTYKNFDWISWPIPSTEPEAEELFSKEVLDEEWD